MFCIKGYPNSVEIESPGADIAFCHLFFQNLFPIWKSTNITLTIGILQKLKFSNDIIYSLKKAFISGCLIHH